MPKGPIFHILTMENQPFQMMILPFAYHTVIKERFTDPVEMRTECAHDTIFNTPSKFAFHF